jgi:hypothetical protein
MPNYYLQEQKTRFLIQKHTNTTDLTASMTGAAETYYRRLTLGHLVESS